MTVLLTLLALALCILGFVGLYTGVRMLRPSVRPQLLRNAQLVGTWADNMRGTVPDLGTPPHLVQTGVVYDRKSDTLRPSRCISSQALADVL